jgi:hypothetical protein
LRTHQEIIEAALRDLDAALKAVEENDVDDLTREEVAQLAGDVEVASRVLTRLESLLRERADSEA